MEKEKIPTPYEYRQLLIKRDKQIMRLQIKIQQLEEQVRYNDQAAANNAKAQRALTKALFAVQEAKGLLVV